MSKVALVTGGSVGYKDGGTSIGSAICFRLAKEGYKIIILDFCEMGKKTEEQIIKAGGEAVFIKTDVSQTDQIKNAIKLAEEKFGGLNCLVNCVGYYTPGMAKSVVDMTETEWEMTLNVNLNSYFKTAKYGIPLMLKSGGGSIINISSIESFIALPNFSVYAVSKAAVDALTRTLAVDFAPQIRANSVCPGFVKIANSENERTSEELEAWYTNISRQYPMKRVCEVDEVANVVSFLASSEASYINGQSIVVDGGKTIADIHEF